jgi:hypothetical protein
MPEKVFISHSSKDQVIADAVRQHLESAGVACWIAPRDIEPGADWTEGIMQGIASSRICVVIFSGHADDSDHIRREVGEFFSLHLPVIPFRTDAVEPRAGLRYFLESVPCLMHLAIREPRPPKYGRPIPSRFAPPAVGECITPRSLVICDPFRPSESHHANTQPERERESISRSCVLSGTYIRATAQARKSL